MKSTMQNNFMILYSGREGSSPLISMLSAQNGVCVPLFEDLDRRNFELNHPNENLADVIDKVYDSGRYDTVKTHGSLFAPGDDPIQSIGFKARLTGSAKAIAPILKAKNVTVFVLFRRNFDDLVGSLYLSHHASAAMPGGAQMNHPQFRLRQLNTDEKKAFLEKYNSISIPANPAAFLELAKKITQNRRGALRRASLFAEQGVRIVPIAYEDFVADRVAFVRQMLNQLGFPPDWPIQDRTKFEKVNVKPTSSKLRFTRVHPAWVSYWYHRLSYGRSLTKLARLAERSAA